VVLVLEVLFDAEELVAVAVADADGVAGAGLAGVLVLEGVEFFDELDGETILYGESGKIIGKQLYINGEEVRK